jgi:hypothetical protein
MAEIVEDYQALVRTESDVHRIRSLRSYRRRLRGLENKGKLILEQPDP